MKGEKGKNYNNSTEHSMEFEFKEQYHEKLEDELNNLKEISTTKKIKSELNPVQKFQAVKFSLTVTQSAKNHNNCIRIAWCFNIETMTFHKLILGCLGLHSGQSNDCHRMVEKPKWLKGSRSVFIFGIAENRQ